MPPPRPSPTHLAPPAPLDLAGPWSCRLDRENLGIARRWFAVPLAAEHTVALPGSLPGHGIGDRVGLDTPWTGGIFDKSFFTSPA